MDVSDSGVIVIGGSPSGLMAGKKLDERGVLNAPDSKRKRAAWTTGDDTDGAPGHDSGSFD